MVSSQIPFRRHRQPWLIAGVLVSGAAVFVGIYLGGALSYAGLAGLVGFTSADVPMKWRGRLPQSLAANSRESLLTCPRCGHRQRETMPTDACQFFYDRIGCGALLRPKPGDCCVFCSYGSVKCPPRVAGAT